MRSVADDDVGAGLDRCVRNLGHVIEHLLAEPPMARRDDEVGFPAQRRDLLGKALQVNAIGPGHDFRRHAGPVHRRDLGPGLMRRDLVGRVSAQHRDAGAALGRLVVGRPVDRTALHEPDLATAARDYRWRRGSFEVRAGAGMGDPEPVEFGDRAEDRRRAVIDVVGDADHRDSGDPQRLAGDPRIGEKPLILDDMSLG